MRGISEGTSKSQLSRAKVILQDMVKKFLEEKSNTRIKP
jgi:RNA polymerase sigma-70 factor (ECF subfamily)